MGCTINKEGQENNQNLLRVEEIEGFSTVNGYKVEDGKFYFTGIKDRDWYFYSLDVTTHEITRKHHDAANYDLYIPFDEGNAVYIDLEGQLFYRIGNEEKKIDEGIRGTHRPNLLISPQQNAILYTKGPEEDADLYLYYFQEAKPILIKEGISKEAFRTFSFTTQWSRKENYFIYHNQEIYDNRGRLYSTVDATITKWSPDDKYLVFIKMPDKGEKIVIGGWETYIGKELLLFIVEEKKTKKIYENPKGLIDPIDSIQWSKDGSTLGMSIGEIIKFTYGELEKMNYEKVFVYDIHSGEGVEVEEVFYNYYEILFDNYLYGSSLGKRDVLELIAVYGEDRKKYENPVILNSQDMFVISHATEGYLVDGGNLMMVNPEGNEEKIATLPWKIKEVYFDITTMTFIIINNEMEIYTLKR